MKYRKIDVSLSRLKPISPFIRDNVLVSLDKSLKNRDLENILNDCPIKITIYRNGNQGPRKYIVFDNQNVLYFLAVSRGLETIKCQYHPFKRMKKEDYQYYLTAAKITEGFGVNNITELKVTPFILIEMMYAQSANRA